MPEPFSLTFDGGDPADQRLFALLYQGFVTGGDTQPQKGIEVIRREVRILDQLEAAGDVSSTGVPVLKADGATLTFRPDEIALIRTYVTGVPWRTTLAREALTLFAKLGVPE